MVAVRAKVDSAAITIRDRGRVVQRDTRRVGARLVEVKQGDILVETAVFSSEERSSTRTCPVGAATGADMDRIETTGGLGERDAGAPQLPNERLLDCS